MTTAIINANNLSIFASIQIAILWYKTQRASAAWIYIDFSRMRPLLCTRNVATNNRWKTAGFLLSSIKIVLHSVRSENLMIFSFFHLKLAKMWDSLWHSLLFFHTDSNHNNEKQELFGVEEKIMKTFAVKTLGIHRGVRNFHCDAGSAALLWEIEREILGQSFSRFCLPRWLTYMFR